MNSGGQIAKEEKCQIKKNVVVIAQNVIAKIVIVVVQIKGGIMPVYLDEKDAIKDFVNRKIDEDVDICIDTSHFASWLYAGKMGYTSSSFDAYQKLLDETTKEFPNIDVDIVLNTITQVLMEGESVWINAWMEYMEPVTKINYDNIELYGYDPSYPDCQFVIWSV